MRETPFHERTRPLNRMQMWFNWDQYVVPDVYTDLHEELRSTRTEVSMGDMSPLSKYGSPHLRVGSSIVIPPQQR